MNSKHLQKLAALIMAVSVSGCLEQVEPNTNTNTNTNLNDRVADASNSAPSIAGNPATAITAGRAYSFAPSANDPDGDSLSFSISGRPSWASFDDVTGRISGAPDMGAVGTHDNIIISVSDGELSNSLPAFSITVNAINSAPTISGNPPGQVNANGAYNFTPTASDADGDKLTFSVDGLPVWASFNTSNGSITGTPSDANIGTDSNIRITVSDTSNASATLGPFSIAVVVTNVNSAPTISGNPRSQVNANSAYNFTPNANDADGDKLTFSVDGLPVWASFNTSSGNITGTPTDADIGSDSNIRITVSDTSNASATLGPFSIAVVANNANSTPTISGNPPAQVTANRAYSFTPTANDADGDKLTFSVDGLPVWASFDTSNGSITGTPTDANVGTYDNISITVSDTSNASATLGPFSIAVVANSAPTISGSPPAQVNANSAYNFSPTANDADGDDLTFSVDGLPVWASFDTSNGNITGTPSDANVDTYNNISITVSDTSNASAKLGPFSITVSAVSLGSVTLDWTPPTKNDDGSDLTDLDGYKIYWGTTPGSYPNSVTLENEGLTTYVVENLVPGTYHFVATSFNTARVESVYSNPATKTVSGQ